MQKEVFVDVKGYEGLYEVSNLGNVKSVERKSWNGFTLIRQPEIILKTGNNGKGYLFVNLSKDNKVKQFYVHRLVAIAFIKNEEDKPQVNHIDGNKANNNVENLEWLTCSENNKHAFETNLRKAPLHEKKQKPFICVETKEYFYSLGDYKNKTGNDREGPRKVLTGKRKQYKGFTFKYI